MCAAKRIEIDTFIRHVKRTATNTSRHYTELFMRVYGGMNPFIRNENPFNRSGVTDIDFLRDNDRVINFALLLFVPVIIFTRIIAPVKGRINE
ncbi:hypothetical protein BGZ97_012364 [Linnemannia gamsii]|uniref:Uncharacterized protein n=1 Tax=Linnemannia gamsii TaxID=64522 RepID=A0A9P6RLX0_9FUNG|nr:hypothetical protein BGZ97_012364 [Linnemannia gamsii]